MKKFLILGHLGLGDQFLMNGLVHYLRKNQDPQTILIVCKNPMKSTLEKLYEDWPSIQTLAVQDDKDISPVFGANTDVLQQYKDDGFQILFLGVHSGTNVYKSLHPSCWAHGFYMQYGIPYWIRYSEFQLPQQNSASQALYQSITQQIGPNYILIHDDPARDLILPYEEIRQTIQQKNYQELPILYLGKDRYNQPLLPHANNPNIPLLTHVETVLEYCTLLYNATACFMMDSSLAILLDLLRPPTNQYRKSYSRYKEFPTQGLYQSVWHYSDAVAK